jgi:hypothetical protein
VSLQDTTGFQTDSRPPKARDYRRGEGYPSIDGTQPARADATPEAWYLVSELAL